MKNPVTYYSNIRQVDKLFAVDITDPNGMTRPVFAINESAIRYQIERLGLQPLPTLAEPITLNEGKNLPFVVLEDIITTRVAPGVEEFDAIYSVIRTEDGGILLRDCTELEAIDLCRELLHNSYKYARMPVEIVQRQISVLRR